MSNSLCQICPAPPLPNQGWVPLGRCIIIINAPHFTYIRSRGDCKNTGMYVIEFKDNGTTEMSVKKKVEESGM